MKTSFITLAMSCSISISAFAGNECNIYSEKYNQLKNSRLSTADQKHAKNIRVAFEEKGYRFVSTEIEASLVLDGFNFNCKEREMRIYMPENDRRPLACLKETVSINLQVIATSEIVTFEDYTYRRAILDLPICSEK